MVALQWLSQPTCRLLTLTLLHFVWQAIGIVVLLILIVELCGVRRSASRYACSLAALLAIGIAPLATFAFFLSSQSTYPLNAAQSLDFIESRPAMSGANWIKWIEMAQPYLLAAWLVGIALFGSRLLTGIAGVVRLRRALLPLPPHVTKIVERLGRRLQIDAMSVVRLSSQVTEAMAIGLLKPLVLIPAAWSADMPVEVLEAVIAHELAHLRRHDLWVNLVQRIVETLLFYHPAVWWLSRRLRIEREMCADELAVAATGDALQYAQALEQVAGEQQADTRPALAAFLRGEKNMRLLQRIQLILGQKPNESGRMWPVGIIALVLPLGLWAAMAFSRVANAADEREETRKQSIKRDRDDDREEAVITRIGDQVIITRKIDNPREKTEEQERRTVDRGRQRIEVEVRDRDRGDQVDRRVTAPDGKPMIALAQRREDERPGSSERRMDELTTLVKQLVQRVERLQDEVSQLRNQKAAVKREAERDEDTIRFNRSADDRSELDARKRELAQAAEKIEAARRELTAKEKALAELAARDRAELRERLRKENPDRSKIEPDDEIVEKIKRAAAEKIRAAEEKARDAIEKGAAAERRQDAEAREQKERAIKELERSRQRKEEAARDKKEAERKELEKKLKELKEGKDSAALEKIDDPQLENKPRKALVKEQLPQY
jgi:beta-lactamase regulating signal transducer with metallopeptidase domain/outer membrane murein-binding lipoprotein Lpp